jgi:hypothetical protein
MALTIEKLELWSGEIRDETGGLAATLAPLVSAGADFSFVIARRQPDKPGTGIVFLGGLRGAKQAKAAQSAGLAKSTGVSALRVEASDKPGLLQTLLAKLRPAGISLRGVSASVIGNRCAILLAFETPADRDQSMRLLRG